MFDFSFKYGTYSFILFIAPHEVTLVFIRENGNMLQLSITLYQNINLLYCTQHIMLLYINENVAHFQIFYQNEKI